MTGGTKSEPLERPQIPRTTLTMQELINSERWGPRENAATSSQAVAGWLSSQPWNSQSRGIERRGLTAIWILAIDPGQEAVGGKLPCW